ARDLPLEVLQEAREVFLSLAEQALRHAAHVDESIARDSNLVDIVADRRPAALLRREREVLDLDERLEPLQPRLQLEERVVADLLGEELGVFEQRRARAHLAYFSVFPSRVSHRHSRSTSTAT